MFGCYNHMAPDSCAMFVDEVRDAAKLLCQKPQFSENCKACVVFAGIPFEIPTLYRVLSVRISAQKKILPQFGLPATIFKYWKPAWNHFIYTLGGVKTAPQDRKNVCQLLSLFANHRPCSVTKRSTTPQILTIRRRKPTVQIQNH